MIDVSKIQNSRLLTDIFGKFPSFHDAEVHQINLIYGEPGAFSPSLTATIHTREMTPQVDEKNQYILKNHVIVEFLFSDVYDIEIKGFSYQNVLQNLKITENPESNSETALFDVFFESIVGVTAKFICGDVSIESVVPYEPRCA
jgi:Immunity protein 50